MNPVWVSLARPGLNRDVDGGRRRVVCEGESRPVPCSNSSAASCDR